MGTRTGSTATAAVPELHCENSVLVRDHGERHERLLQSQSSRQTLASTPVFTSFVASFSRMQKLSWASIARLPPPTPTNSRSETGSLKVPPDPDHHQSADEESNGGSSTGQGRPPSLANNMLGGSGSSTDGASKAPPRRDKTKEELANTKRELERCQKNARFYRKEMEQCNYDLQRAIGDNRVFSRSVHELQSANARLKDHLLSSQQELASVQVKLDNNQGHKLKAAHGMLTEADGLDTRNSSAYTPGLTLQ